jgi:hypothetical protein
MIDDKVFLILCKLIIEYTNISHPSRYIKHRFTGHFTFGKYYSTKAFEFKDISAH